MIRPYLLPLIAVCGIAFAGWTVAKSHQPIPVAPPAAAPASTTFADFVAGAGLIEPSTEVIAIGTPVGGVVAEVPVASGAEVKAGALLFRLDDRSLRAQLAVREAALAVARAGVAVAEAGLADAQQQAARFESVADKRAVSSDDLERRRNAVAVAAARRAEAQAQAAQAEAQARGTQVEIARLSVCAPADGTVLQVKVRVGEFAPTGVLQTPLMMFGATATLHVRVDIDEHDAWRVAKDAKAEAFVRGNRDLRTELRFVRCEPYVVPKRSLTGDSTERVDTRVLQVIYAFPRQALPAVYVGQQMDVFIAAPPLATAAGRAPQPTGGTP
jgi:RND family efflux transporter MFP subunit